jgi:hypothetical protein
MGDFLELMISSFLLLTRQQNSFLTLESNFLQERIRQKNHSSSPTKRQGAETYQKIV